MKLPVFSVAGEALNFGARSMETIMRVAWLPVVLLLVLEMATIYAYLSVIAGQVITFEHVPSFTRAQQLLQQYGARGWANNPSAMWTITIGYWVLLVILLSSFVAPLIRLAGLGERPAPGVARLPFGLDQIRLIIAGLFSVVTTGLLSYAPLWAVGRYVGKYIDEAVSKTFVSFPDPDSLHQIELVSGRDVLTESGQIWIYDYGAPWIAAIPFAVVLWLILIAHFHPKNRLYAGAPNLLARAFWSGLGVAAMTLAAFLALRVSLHMSGNADAVPFAPTAVVLLILSYLALRFFPYPGVAVSRKSLAPGPVWRVTRGSNILRLLAVVVLISGLLLAALYVINWFVLGGVMISVINSLYQAVASAAALVGGGERPEWILALFIWIWNGIRILINVFWTFFFYGVMAGLWGRLYRESERAG
ncbi:MAG: hypothetical protein ACE5FO_06990 [Parvularculaceae bacterium]